MWAVMAVVVLVFIICAVFLRMLASLCREAEGRENHWFSIAIHEGWSEIRRGDIIRQGDKWRRDIGKCIEGFWWCVFFAILFTLITIVTVIFS